MKYPEVKTKWLSNTIDPKIAQVGQIPGIAGQTPKQAYFEWLNWIKQHRIGRPKETEKYSVKQLENMGYVGIYSKE